MSEFCHSCTAPLSNPTFKGSSDTYCKHCTDENGNLKPREEVRQGIAGWLASWQGGISKEVALTRADHFMKGLPARAED